jgi:hypothetical protein
MKKKTFILGALISLVFLAPVFPATAAAIEPGYGREVGCRVWRESDGDGFLAGRCSHQNDAARRIYELERAVADLQKNQGRNSESSSGGNSDVRDLERRISVLERAVSTLQQTVLQGLQAILAAVLGR